MIHRRLDWQDGVQVVAVLLHAVFVDVRGILDGNELPVRQFRDVLHHSGHGQVYCSGDGAVAGMTLMCAAILAVEQIGVDRDGSVTDVHEKQFIGQREKVLAVAFEYRNHVLIQQSATVEFGNLLHSHVLAHVQLGCDFIRTGQGIFVAVDMQIAEIGEDGKPLGFQFPFPDTIWNWEAASLWIRLIEKETHLCTPPSVFSITH